MRVMECFKFVKNPYLSVAIYVKPHMHNIDLMRLDTKCSITSFGSCVVDEVKISFTGLPVGVLSLI